MNTNRIMRNTQAKVAQDALDVAAVVDRMRAAYGATSDARLAAILEESQSTIASWRARGSMPLRHVANASRRSGRTVDWLLFGDDAQDALVRAALEKHVFESFMALPLVPAARGGRSGLQVNTSNTESHGSAPQVSTGSRSKSEGNAPGAHSPAPASGASLSPVRTTTPQSGVLPLWGDGPHPLGGALLAPAAAELTRPLVLPVSWDSGRATREFEVIPTLKSAAHAGAPGSDGSVGR